MFRALCIIYYCDKITQYINNSVYFVNKFKGIFRRICIIYRESFLIYANAIKSIKLIALFSL